MIQLADWGRLTGFRDARHVERTRLGPTWETYFSESDNYDTLDLFVVHVFAGWLSRCSLSRQQDSQSWLEKRRTWCAVCPFLQASQVLSSCSRSVEFHRQLSVEYPPSIHLAKSRHMYTGCCLCFLRLDNIVNGLHAVIHIQLASYSCFQQGRVFVLPFQQH